MSYTIEYLKTVKKRIVEDKRSLTSICKEDKKSVTAVGRALKEKLNFFSIKNNQKYFYNSSIFKQIDTEEKAYWLGFLYADGYVEKREVKGSTKNAKNKISYKVELCLAEKDKKHIEKFAKFMLKEYKEEIIKKKIIKLNDKKHLAYRITVANKEIVEDLIKLNCLPNKSLILTFPTEEQVPKKLIHHFIRGYFDGDGCIYFNKEKKLQAFNLVGTREFLEYIINFFNKEKITITKLQKKGNAFSYHKGGKKDILKIKEILYKDAKTFLNRKKEKFDLIK